MPLMSRGVLRLVLHCRGEIPPSALPIVAVERPHGAPRRQRASGARILGQHPLGGRQRRRHGLIRRQHSVDTQGEVYVGQPDERRQKSRRLRRRRAQKLQAPAQARFGSLVPVEAALEVRLVCGGADGRRFHQPGLPPQGDLECLDDRVGDVVLEIEDVTELPVVPLGPKLEPGGHIHELGGDSKAVAAASDAPFEHGSHLEFPADGAHVLMPRLEGEGGGSCRDSEISQLGEGVDQLVGETVAQIFVVLTRAHIVERQHRDGRDRRCRGPVHPGVQRSSPVRRAAANSAMEEKRRSRSRSSAFITARSTARGTSGRTAVRLRTGSVDLRVRIAMAVGPLNGISPASISKSRHARLYWSLRPSMSGAPKLCPRSCTRACRGCCRSASASRPRPRRSRGRCRSPPPARGTEGGDALPRGGPGQQDVGGLDVAVDDLLAVGVVERIGDLAGQAHRLGYRKASEPLQPLPQGFSARPAASRNRGGYRPRRSRRSAGCAGVGAGRRCRFPGGTGPPHPRRALRAEHLDRDLSPVLQVARGEDPGHAPGTDLPFDEVPVTQDRLQPGDGVGHRRRATRRRGHRCALLEGMSQYGSPSGPGPAEALGVRSITARCERAFLFWQPHWQA